MTKSKLKSSGVVPTPELLTAKRHPAPSRFSQFDSNGRERLGTGGDNLQRGGKLETEAQMNDLRKGVELEIKYAGLEEYFKKARRSGSK